MSSRYLLCRGFDGRGCACAGSFRARAATLALMSVVGVFESFEFAAWQEVFADLVGEMQFGGQGERIGVVGADVAMLMRDRGPRGGVVARLEQGCCDLEQAGVPHVCECVDPH